MEQQQDNRHIQFPSMIWWIGVVEDRNDPLALGRCRVRIVSHHNPDANDLPTNELMWAVPVMPFHSASISGIGLSPTGIVQGSTVIGFFIDGEKAQQPAILGTIPGAPTWTDRERGRIIDNDFLASLTSMFNGDTEKDYTEGPDETTDLREMLIERAEFEMPFLDIPPNFDYENSLGVSAPSTGKMDSEKSLVFRHLFAVFASNINYLCVSKTGKVGKYQFPANFLKNQGFLSGNSIFEHNQWSGKENIYSLSDFLHAFDLQEELYVDYFNEISSSANNDSLQTLMGDMMVGMLIEDGLSNWDGETNYIDDEGRSATDAFRKGLLAAYYAEQLDEE